MCWHVVCTLNVTFKRRSIHENCVTQTQCLSVSYFFLRMVDPTEGQDRDSILGLSNPPRQEE